MYLSQNSTLKLPLPVKRVIVETQTFLQKYYCVREHLGRYAIYMSVWMHKHILLIILCVKRYPVCVYLTTLWYMLYDLRNVYNTIVSFSDCFCFLSLSTISQRQSITSWWQFKLDYMTVYDSIWPSIFSSYLLSVSRNRNKTRTPYVPVELVE